jgi:hypothetical protein
MPLFQCQQCGSVENTACCNYWSAKSGGRSILCSECDPAIGKWHNLFPKRSAVGMLIDQQGHLWSKENVASLPDHYKIVGEVTAPDPKSGASGS